jgi:hypothetical protein
VAIDQRKKNKNDRNYKSEQFTENFIFFFCGANKIRGGQILEINIVSQFFCWDLLIIIK